MIYLDFSTEILAISLPKTLLLFRGSPPLALEELLERPTAIATGQGPGSYTGLRASSALAQGLAAGYQIPLFSFCSLAAFAPDEKTPVLFDARGGGVYMRQNGEVTKVDIASAAKALAGESRVATPDMERLSKRFGDVPWSWALAAPTRERLLSLPLSPFGQTYL